MSLVTLFVDTKHSVSYDVDPNYQPEVYEAGRIGIVSRSNGKTVVRPALPDDTNVTLLGVIDESKKMALLGSVSTQDLANLGLTIPIGPHTTVASGKVTLHMTPGIYVTDQFSSNFDVDNPPNTGDPIYVDDQINGLITNIGAIPIGVFIDFVVNLSLGDSQSSVDSTKRFLVFKFDPLSAALIQDQATLQSAVTSANSFIAEAEADCTRGNAIYVETGTGKFGLATNNGPLSKAKVIGFALNSAGVGQVANILTDGLLEENDWTFLAGTTNLIPGASYYLGVNGNITSAAPSLPSASYLTKVGTALTTKIFKINIEPTIVL